MASVKIQHVSKAFGGNVVLKEINETFQDGEFITLLGPSGCGKTTLLRIIAGFERQTSGEVYISDKLVSGGKTFIPPEKRGIGMVFQSYAVWPHMNVFDNVAYPLTIRKVPKDDIRQSVQRPTDYEFSGNGIVYGGDRTPSPKMQEVRFNYRNIRVEFTDRGFLVKNRFLFTDTGAFRTLIILQKNGEELCRQEITVPVPPLAEAEFAWPESLLQEMAVHTAAARSLGEPEPEFSALVSFCLKEDRSWAAAGHEIAFGQKVFPRRSQNFSCEEPLTVVRGKSIVGVRGKHFSAQFSAIHPGLTSYIYAGTELIEKIPMPNFWRAPIDNDRGSLMPQRYAQWKIASLYATAKNGENWDLYPAVENLPNSVTVSYRYFLPTVPAASCRVS